MARTAELILRLVDQVTGPAKVVNRALRGVNQIAGQLGNVGRGMRRNAAEMAGFSIPVLGLATDAARQVYEFEKIGNAMEAASMMTAEQREAMEDYVQVLNAAYPATNAEIMGAANELSKAGMDFASIQGSLKSTLNLALAGDYGIPEAADVLVSVATAMRLPMKSLEEVQKSTETTSDVIAYAAQSSLANIDDIAITSKYVAPLAAAAGMSITEMGAAIATLAQAGIKGSNAGTGLRFALFSILSPSKAAQAALAKLNINIGDYVTGARQATAIELGQNMAIEGFDISGLGLDDAINKVLTDPAIMKAPAKMANELTTLIGNAMGETDPIDLDKLNESLNRNLGLLGTNVDFKGFMAALRANPDSDMFFDDIFGKQHGAKMMALNAGDFEGTLADMELKYRGAAQRMSTVMTKGIVGDWGRMTAAVENLWITLSDVGILTDVTRGINAFADGVENLAKLNPEVLKLGTYAILAVAGVAPLSWALSGLAATIGFISSPLTIVVGSLAYLTYLNWNQVTYFFAGFTRFFREGLSPETLALFQQVADGFRDLWSAGKKASGLQLIPWGISLGKALASVVNHLPDFVAGILQLRDQVMPILQQFAPVAKTIGKTMQVIGQALVTLGQGAWAGLIQGITNFNAAYDQSSVDRLNGYAQALWNFLDAKNSTDEAAIKKAGADSGSWAQNTLAWMGTVAGGMGTATVKEIDGIANAAGRAQAALGNMWHSMENAYVWAVMDIRLKTHEFIQWIKDTFMSIDLAAIGLSIINTLWTGMQTGFANLMTNIASAAAGIGPAIAGAFSGGSAPRPQGVVGGVAAGDNPMVAGSNPVPHAKGGAYRPGMILTGEKGPELQMASGSGQIFTAKETRAMLSGKHGGGDQHNTFHITGSNADEIAQKVSAILDRKLQRSRGLSMNGRPEFG